MSGRSDPIIGMDFYALVVLVEDHDIGDEGAGFPSVNDRHPINPHKHVDQLKVQVGSEVKASLEMPTQFITPDQDAVRFVPPADNGGGSETDRGYIMLLVNVLPSEQVWPSNVSTCPPM